MIGFGEYGRFGKSEDVYQERNFGSSKEIQKLDDERLVFINPNLEGFYSNVLDFVTDNEYLKAFQEAIKEVKEEQPNPFWKPIYDPAIEHGKIVFEAGKHVASGGTGYTFWENKIHDLPSVEGKQWCIGTEYQYYALLTWLINQLIEKEAWSVEKAMTAIVINPRILGLDYRVPVSKEKTGSDPICGICDLGRTYKYLTITNKNVSGCWIASTTYWYDEKSFADLFHYNKYSDHFDVVGWLVISS